MEAYAQVLNYAIPFFVLLILIEHFVAMRMGVKINRGADMISSLSSGVTNTIKDVLGLTVAIISYTWLVKHVAIFEIKATWLVYLVAFIVKDFSGYWVHRLEHEINFLWNRHIIHHSSEEFNLSCALRQSVSVVFSFAAFFMIPAALLGVPAKVFAVVAPLHLFAQFWYHTRLIGKMGWLENIIVTPTHHRVHHAMNAEYLDKNYGQILIIWDKLFGTFQPELENVQPVYGVKRPVKTWNPILINFQHLWLLIKDAWHAQNWADKFKIWIKPTGWRPKDVAEKYPVESVQDVFRFEKFHTQLSQKLLVWSWFQFGATLLLMFYMFNNIADISFSGLLLYGLFLFVSIYSFTTLLDKNPDALWFEILKTGFGLALIYAYGDWFGMSRFWEGGTYLVAAYLLVCVPVVAYFSKTEGEAANAIFQKI
ncbi:MAG TPA: sterol desaturase family protein [Saprospiraceae bacterium]|nr:sterol desaturase family protein [Saprospiraceae bacterium]